LGGGGGETHVEFFSTQLDIFLPDFEFVSKSYGCFTKLTPC
jgi:hypothetical protein